MMTFLTLSTLRASLVAVTLVPGLAASAQDAPAHGDDVALAYAQCIRDEGYAEFPDPGPDGFQFVIAPEDVSRFHDATAACRALAPEGFRDEDASPEALNALVTLAQCLRDNGLSSFPNPSAKGGFDLTGIDIGPGDDRLAAAMTACSDEADQAGPLSIGG